MNTTTTTDRAPVEPGTARWKELVAQGIVKDATRNWFLGDAALEIVPMGNSSEKNDRDSLLGAYADEIGVDPNSLRQYRQVASAWPAANRVAATSWKVHSMFMGHQELIEADGPGVRITVTRAHELLNYGTSGRTGPRSSPEAKARQTRDALADPRVLAQVVADQGTLSNLLAQPTVAEQIEQMLREQVAGLAERRMAAEREAAATTLAEAQAEAERLRATVAADATTEDATEGAIDEAAGRIAELTRALERAQAANDRLTDDVATSSAQRKTAREQLTELRTQLKEERDLHAERQAELVRLRKDPERIARAEASKQYEWVLAALQQAITPLARLDTRLDTELVVVQGEYQEALLRTVDALSMRLTAIRSKLGGEWTASL